MVRSLGIFDYGGFFYIPLARERYFALGSRQEGNVIVLWTKLHALRKRRFLKAREKDSTIPRLEGSIDEFT
jgi:hypothetical protein